jgi:signal transduction histidine kinase
LSIANWIVERHGGKIEVASQDGTGTTFCIWLPLYSVSSPEAVNS